MGSWFLNCLPTIKEIKLNLPFILKDIDKIKGVKGLYLCGEAYQNIDFDSKRVKDIDVIAKTSFHSGDLLSIDNKILDLNLDDNCLENRGYDPYAIFFSQEFTKKIDYNINKWAVSCDNKILHWGAIPDNQNDIEYIFKEAEKFADISTGIKLDKAFKKGNKDRQQWYDNYKQYLSNYCKDMPSGWYKTELIKKKDFFKNKIKI